MNEEVAEPFYRVSYQPPPDCIMKLDWSKGPLKLLFYRAGIEIGCMDFSVSPARFTGDADDSARAFWEAIVHLMPEHLKVGITP